MSHRPGLNRPHAKPQLEGFSAISLSELDARAELLERMDQKYVVNNKVLDKALEHWSPHFDILDIDGNRSFRYDNCYFDDADFKCYQQHQQDRRVRFKVRTRLYTDSNTCFVEIKLKGPRGRTIKQRVPCSPEYFGMLDDSSREFIAKAYYAIYGRKFSFELLPSIKVSYYRSTLAAIEGHERITIDTQIQFSCEDETFSVNPDLVIIETKSPNRNGLAEKILRGLHQHPVSACSKYCIGMAVLGKVKRYNRFLKAMRKLQLIPTPRQPQKPLELTNTGRILNQSKHSSEEAHVI
ncbi:MAG: vacuolar transporter [SAR86 cluster bacterium]|uniref:Vacuolar transporter n=1 Tax=SAR86 cluster bacterium TaxID=2030880 RepID=A0A2A5CDG2_9GAMM|nr:polyphosphate polymerase domain-containing protein [Gammaproteobacteria bacterium AH-315-E17]PCJ41793.1 MAG: vacuolar transporter [SAR86 cluster bacterium]PCJ43830.1 MAG: vacuolar transporter [SAR86 cluster bacterium]